MRDRHNWTGPTLFGVKGGIYSALASSVLLDALGRRKLGACLGPAQIDLITVVSPIRPSGGLEGEERSKKLRYF